MGHSTEFLGERFNKINQVNLTQEMLQNFAKFHKQNFTTIFVITWYCFKTVNKINPEKLWVIY